MKLLAFAFSRLCAVTAVFLLCACGFVHDEHLIGPYRLIAIDVSEEMSIRYSMAGGDAIGRINSTVFAYGWNDKYIVAKQHPMNNRAVTNYYYLDIAKDGELVDPSVSVVGPMTEREFSLRTMELNLPPFIRTIKSLE